MGAPGTLDQIDQEKRKVPMKKNSLLGNHSLCVSYRVVCCVPCAVRRDRTNIILVVVGRQGEGEHVAQQRLGVADGECEGPGGDHGEGRAWRLPGVFIRRFR